MYILFLIKELTKEFSRLVCNLKELNDEMQNSRKVSDYIIACATKNTQSHISITGENGKVCQLTVDGRTSKMLDLSEAILVYKVSKEGIQQYRTHRNNLNENEEEALKEYGFIWEIK